jgi:hypothetical protein
MALKLEAAHAILARCDWDARDEIDDDKRWYPAWMPDRLENRVFMSLRLNLDLSITVRVFEARNSKPSLEASYETSGEKTFLKALEQAGRQMRQTAMLRDALDAVRLELGRYAGSLTAYDNGLSSVNADLSVRLNVGLEVAGDPRVKDGDPCGVVLTVLATMNTPDDFRDDARNAWTLAIKGIEVCETEVAVPLVAIAGLLAVAMQPAHDRAL